MIKDLTEGKTLSLILGFSIPLLFGYLFQQFYNVVDTIIVGKFLGVDALAAVGATGPVNFLTIGFVLGLCSGFSIPISQKFGAKHFDTMRKYVYTSALLSVGFSVLLTVITVAFCKPLLRIMLTPPNIINQSTSYIRIIFLGIPLIFLYNMVSGIIRAVGDSKTPVIFLLISSVLNIVLDLVCIINLHLGIAGAALATIISTGIAGIISFIYLIKTYDILKLKPEDKKIGIKHIVTLCNVGIPMGLQYSVTAIGSVILQVSVNTLGSNAVAAVTAGAKINMFICTPFDALGVTMATFGGQNAGAGKFDRLKKGVVQSSLLAFAYGIIACLILILWGDTISLLFLDASNTEIIHNTHTFLIMNSSFYFSLALVNIVRFMIQGMGFSAFAILSGIFEMIARTFIGLFAVPIFGFGAVCFASPAAWILADFFLIPAFLHCWNQLIKISNNTGPMKW
ncbi:MAG: MATE family efflux transporter [Treponema sp.]|nr:MATE family efflux transporter [Treponema sp.]